MGHWTKLLLDDVILSMKFSHLNISPSRNAAIGQIVCSGYTVLRGTLYRSDCNSKLYTHVKNKRISTRFHFENDNTSCIKADYKPLSILSLHIPEYTWILLNRLIAYRFKSHVMAIFTFLFNQECKLVPLSELSTTPNREAQYALFRRALKHRISAYFTPALA